MIHQLLEAIGFKNKHDAEWGSGKDVVANGGDTTLSQSVTLIKVEAPLHATRMTTIAMMAFPKIDPTAPQLPNPIGPLIGIVEFSGGGGGGVIEFDVPCNGGGNAQFVGNNRQIGGTEGGGAMVSVPGSIIKAYVRNDANLKPTLMMSGIGGANPISIGVPAIFGIVKAFVGYQQKTGHLTRTVWCTRNNPVGVPAGASTFINVPPFARSFRLLRDQTVAADTITIDWRGPLVIGNPLETFVLAGGIVSPEFALGPTSLLNLTFTAGNAGTLRSLAVVFDIEN
jgi:hypothetical protein